jgi:hypothetical protein
VVVENGVEVGGAGARLVAASGQSGRRAFVVSALLAADEAVAAAVGDVTELGQVDMDQLPGMVVLVAADRLPGDPVDPRQPVRPAADQNRVGRRSRNAEPSADLDRAEPVSAPQPHDLTHHRWRCPGRGGGFQPSSTISWANRARARRVKAALAWDTKASWATRTQLLGGACRVSA